MIRRAIPPPGAVEIDPDQNGAWLEGWVEKRVDRGWRDVAGRKRHPLPPGREPVVLSFEMSRAVDFNKYDFGVEITRAEAMELLRNAK